MSAYLLHQGATVQCDHAGPAQPMPTYPRVKVAGQAVVTQQATYAITGCSLSGTSSPPCATARYVTAATRVKAGGAPVILSNSQARCVPTGGGLTAASTQTRVKGT
jgi:hypothetical protein